MMIGTNAVKIWLSTSKIVFTPSDAQNFARAGNLSSADLEVTVTNTSDRFASFQLTLEADSHTFGDTGEWYQVAPNASAKKPPGDKTTFYINLLKSPVPSYETTLPLTLTVFSAELPELAATETIELQILRPTKSLKVYFPVKALKVYPQTKLQIPVLVYNLAPIARTIDLKITAEGTLSGCFVPGDLEQSEDGSKKSLQIEAGCSAEAYFWCMPKIEAHSYQGLYAISVEACDRHPRNKANSNSAIADHKIEVLPFGSTTVNVSEAPSDTTDNNAFWKNSRIQTARFLWEFKNKSNLQQHISLNPNPEALKASDQVAANGLTLEPIEEKKSSLKITTKRPWLGWKRSRFIEVTPYISHPGSGESIPEITLQPASHILPLNIKPIVPLWIQLLVGLCGLLGLWWFLMLMPRTKHTAAVSSTALVVSGETVFSGSRDRTLQRWGVNRSAWLPDARPLSYVGQVKEFPQSVRVIEPSPNSKEIAVGLENGTIELFKIEPATDASSLLRPNDTENPERIFDLAFTKDAQHLFSAYGSGKIRQWNLFTRSETGKDFSMQAPNRDKAEIGNISSVISAIAVIEQNERGKGSADQEKPASLVAIAGQFNRLILWDWKAEQAYEIRYRWQELELAANSSDSEAIFTQERFEPAVSQNSYLTSIDVSDDGSTMVTADSAGFITTWNVQNLRNCMDPALEAHNQNQTLGRFPIIDPSSDGDTACSEALIDQWSAGSLGKAIRAVSITNNGCYLASTGDAGKIQLWQLTEEGERFKPGAKKVATFTNALLNTVDIHLAENNTVLVAADAPGDRIQLYRKKMGGRNGCQ